MSIDKLMRHIELIAISLADMGEQDAFMDLVRFHSTLIDMQIRGIAEYNQRTSNEKDT